MLRSYRTLPKSGKARHIPINPELSKIPKILRDWRDREDRPTTADGLVFPVPDGADGWRMGVDWETLGLDGLLKAAGCHVPKKAWHALRHTFTSHFVMSGGNILTLQKLLGHSDIAPGAGLHERRDRPYDLRAGGGHADGDTSSANDVPAGASGMVSKLIDDFLAKSGTASLKDQFLLH